MPKKENRKRSNKKKRQQILNAAVQVFARKGFHRCRISDIAAEANVAYGLVYHYFENKEEILNTIFDENWGVFNKVLDTAAEQTDDLEGTLESIVTFICDAYRLFPEIIQVMVIETARSTKFLKKPKLDTYEKAFNRLAEIFSGYQRSGQINPDLNPKIMAYSIFGSLELIFTGILLNTIRPEGDMAIEKLKPRLVKMLLDGIRLGGGQAS